jgi:hypothetical protein
MDETMRYSTRVIYRLRRLLTLDGYATAPVWLQLVILVVISTVLIYLFAPLWGSLKESYLIFVDQSAIVDAQGWIRVGLGLIELLIGIIVAGFIISILTSTLENFVREIRTGSLAYKRSKHVLIVNQNNKLFHMLREMNKKFEDMSRIQDVVILLRGKQDVEAFWDAYSVENHQYLSVYVKHGVPLVFESFAKVSLLKASAAVILIDKNCQNPYEADNINIKILSTVLNNNKYRDLLVERSKEKNPLRCTVELNNTYKAKEIAEAISTIKDVSTFSVVTPLSMISRILSRSLVDIVYFKIYSEIFSFQGHEIYFVNPKKWAGGADFVGKTFEELHLGFGKGLLIGFSRVTGSDFEVLLNPFQEKLLDEDWFIFLAREEHAIEYDGIRASVAGHDSPPTSIEQPSEIVARKICMIGDYHDLSQADGFLDEESKKGFQENIFVNHKMEDYFDENKIDQIRAKNFDSVIINLEDKIAVRLTLYILSLHKHDSDFISKLITVVENPVTAEILAGSLKNKNIILSEKLAANFIGQITFQKNLTHVLEELTSPVGNEFNLLEIGRDISPDLLTSKAEVKQLLIENGMTYIGSVDRNKDIQFDADTFENASHIIVLSGGTE